LRARTEDSATAFERLLASHQREIFRYLYRMLRHQQDAEDLTQTVFLKAYASIAKLDPSRNPRAWLYRIATTTAYDHWRKSKSAPVAAFSFDEAIDSETIDEPSSYYDVKTAIDLDLALTKLKPAYQTVLNLYYGQELSYTDIAETLDIPLGTVKTYISRAKQALKEHLPGYG